MTHVLLVVMLNVVVLDYIMVHVVTQSAQMQKLEKLLSLIVTIQIISHVLLVALVIALVWVVESLWDQKQNVV